MQSGGRAGSEAGLAGCPQGISAVKALALAAAQGQRIYTITQKVFQDKPGLVSSHLSAHSWDTRQRVQQALEAGQEVTIHQRPVLLQDGWAGAGFVLLDPETGAGRYLIEGGGNGGALVGLGVGLVSGIAIIMAGPVVAGLVGVIGFLIGVIYALTLSISDLLSFAASRLIGTFSGIVLSVIIGQYILVSFPPIFVIGLLWLMLTIIHLLILEISIALAESAGLKKMKVFV